MSGNAEETRAYLQARLLALFELMFWSFVALMAFLWCLYHVNPEVEPRNNQYVYLSAAIGLAIMGVLWRVFLAGRTLSTAALHRIDLIYSGGCGLAFALNAAISYDFHPAAYTCLIYTCYTVLTRALVVPSTGTRTAVASVFAFVPMTAAACVLAFNDTAPLPPAAFLVGYAVVAVVAILLAAAGSKIIYGLRREVSAAQQLGQYRLIRKIGEGGMGSVHLAHHMMLRRPTAVKLVLPTRNGADILERFEREVRLTSQLSHPNTVAIYDYGRSFEGVFYYAMEYLGNGVDLEKLVRDYGPQPAGRVVHVLTQVCGALQEAHDHGLIHRDIKPANIILCQRGGLPDVAKVVDFGLVKEITSETGNSTQVLLGTPAYLAPEAINDPASVGPGVDLYALGAVGYFLLTGKRVFDGKTAVELCIQHVGDVPKRPSEVSAIHIPSDLEDVIMRCLAKRPSERHASAAELAAALRALAVDATWDRATARAWWREVTAVSDPSTAVVETMTIDFGERAAA